MSLQPREKSQGPQSHSIKKVQASGSGTKNNSGSRPEKRDLGIAICRNLVLLRDAPIRSVSTSINASCLAAVKNTRPLRRWWKKIGIEVNPSPGLHFTAWEEELENDCDKSFLLTGIKDGFDIIDDDVHVTPVLSKNHPSASPSSPLFKKATEQVKKELASGNHIICDMPPKIVSPMAAIPKPEGDVRLIHDCSRPVGQAVNNYCSSEWSQKFSTIDDATALLSEGCNFANVDLKSAYRSINISHQSQKVTGLQWNFGSKTVYMRDTKPPFGS